jgi:hypothetical protein
MGREQPLGNERPMGPNKKTARYNTGALIPERSALAKFQALITTAAEIAGIGAF